MPSARSGENAVPPAGTLAIAHLFGVDGKTALVTGGGSGIGAMIACTLVQNGCHVFISSRKDTSEYAKELNVMGPGKCESVSGIDLAKQEDIQRLAQTLKDKLPHGLHILVNNSGTNYAATLENTSMEMFEKVFRLNVMAVFGLTQALKPMLDHASAPGDPSRVVNISSINGIRAPPMDTFAYSSSKAAVIHLTKHMALKMGPSVTVNDIAPGPFFSRMMRATLEASGESIRKAAVTGKIGHIEDIGGAVVYLCPKTKKLYGRWRYQHFSTSCNLTLTPTHDPHLVILLQVGTKAEFLSVKSL